MTDPTFTIEDDKVGLGFCVIALWPDGRREVVTGFGNIDEAERWIKHDASTWLMDIPKQVRGEHWVNERLPKADDEK